MREGDFGAREIFFMLFLVLLTIVVAWVGTYLFTQTIEFIGGMLNLLGFALWLMFQ